MENAIDIIKRDHRAVEEMYAAFLEATEEEQEELGIEICDQLDMHALMEETHFYPVVREEGGPELQEMVEESFEEHAELKTLIAEFRLSVTDDTEDDEIPSKMEAIMSMVKHHVEEEEQELLPMVEKSFSAERLNELGEVMGPESPSAAA